MTTFYRHLAAASSSSRGVLRLGTSSAPLITSVVKAQAAPTAQAGTTTVSANAVAIATQSAAATAAAQAAAAAISSAQQAQDQAVTACIANNGGTSDSYNIAQQNCLFNTLLTPAQQAAFKVAQATFVAAATQLHAADSNTGCVKNCDTSDNVSIDAFSEWWDFYPVTGYRGPQNAVDMGGGLDTSNFWPYKDADLPPGVFRGPLGLYLHITDFATPNQMTARRINISDLGAGTYAQLVALWSATSQTAFLNTIATDPIVNPQLRISQFIAKYPQFTLAVAGVNAPSCALTDVVSDVVARGGFPLAIDALNGSAPLASPSSNDPDDFNLQYCSSYCLGCPSDLFPAGAPLCSNRVTFNWGSNGPANFNLTASMNSNASGASDGTITYRFVLSDNQPGCGIGCTIDKIGSDFEAILDVIIEAVKDAINWLCQNQNTVSLAIGATAALTGGSGAAVATIAKAGLAVACTIANALENGTTPPVPPLQNLVPPAWYQTTTGLALLALGIGGVLYYALTPPRQ